MSVRLSDDERLRELSRFLKDRRARLTPADVGLANTTRRRVRGLRREEVASLANIGVSWYTALENGDAANVSDATLGSVANALRLSDAERRYLFALAGRVETAEPIDTPSRLLITTLMALSLPAYISTVTWDIVACNDAFRVIWEIGPDEVPFNAITRLFLDARGRRLHGEHYSANIRPAIAMIRSAIVRRPNLPELRSIRDVLLKDEQSRALWEAFEVSDPFVPTHAEIDSPVGIFSYEALNLMVPDVLHALIVQVPDEQSLARLTKVMPHENAPVRDLRSRECAVNVHPEATAAFEVQTHTLEQ